jgi:sugar-phosphatase
MAEWSGDAIIFDLDGVLIDANSVYERHWQAWAERNQVPFADILAVHHGRPAAQTVEIVAPHLDPQREAADYNRSLLADTDLTGVLAFPGVAKLLSSLPADRWAIATSAPLPVAIARLGHLALPQPDVLVTADDVARGKPEPDPYLMAARGLGYPPQQCLVIEDAPAGIKAATAAGTFVLAVTTTHGSGELNGANGLAARLVDITVGVDANGVRVAWPDVGGPAQRS